MSLKILILLTSVAKLGATDRPTGFWFEELAAPYYELVAAGAEVDIASPKGGSPPADPGSLKNPPPVVARFKDDPIAMKKLEHSLPVASIHGGDDAYFVAGGHGVMWDLAVDPAVAALLGAAADEDKVVAAVCHGPAAFAKATRKNGESIVKGRRVAGFTNEEEKAAHLDDVVPFALQTRLIELGGRYEHGPMFQPFAVRDGKLVTGQNPQSSVATAREVLAALGVAPPHK
jgi:putative intracellular protease/amidase